MDHFIGKTRIAAVRGVRPARAWLLAGSLALLGACGGGGEPPSEASAVIGAAGGTLEGPDGVQLVVPAGALTQDTTLRIARTGAGAPVLPDGYASSTPSYEFTPHGLSFNAPVTIRMPYGTPAGAEHADLFMASPGEDWRAMQATLANGKAEWQRLSFSYTAGLACAIPANNTDPYVCVWPRLGVPLSATPAQALVRNSAYSTLSHSTVSGATTLRFTLNYSAARDCADARVRILRRNNGVGAVSTLLDQAVSPAQQDDKRAGGTLTFDLPLTQADNGSAWFGVSFSCVRPGRSRTTDGYAHVVAIAIPEPGGPTLPTIAQQPAGQSVTAPAAATFSAAAVGDPAPGVQWQRSTDGGAHWSDISGATGAAYTTPATTTADNGTQYRAVFSNSAGSATSNAVVLNVNAGTTDIVAYAWDFDAARPTLAPFVGDELTVDVANAYTLEDGQGFKGLGPAGAEFAGQLLRMPTGATLMLDLSGLPAHSALSLQFLLAAIDSLDGTGTFPAGDFFHIQVDGVTVLRESFANAMVTQVQSYVPPAGGELARRVQLGFQQGQYMDDSAYDMAVEPRLQRIAHTGSRVTITFVIEGDGAQPLTDESWGMDNLRVLLHP